MVVLIVGGATGRALLTGGPTTYRFAVTSAAGADIVRAADGVSSDTSIDSELVASAADAQSTVTAGDVDAALISAPDGRAVWTLSRGNAGRCVGGVTRGGRSGLGDRRERPAPRSREHPTTC